MWANADPRHTGQTLLVEQIDRAVAVCRVLTVNEGRSSWPVGRLRRIRADRFRPTTRGYTLISSAQVSRDG